ncbi:alpha/beta hydrolase fold protein [Hyphomonas adhaerens MHS-3]|uniref:Alpha/beta hydrolase fold protein n=1 Tax=Hyphomonas adhaerens MHS-3 TaxID=1280949 RepID=A0A069E7R4_9PROT|nr:alpha/beta hydrolase [Hyphomonas adhaerens]KCZ86019.1 alpha/beta hydrolase fold protein [Hyphomonas adhaerens MHS-3]
MSLWLDFLSASIRYVDLPTMGKTRIAEAGVGNPETLILMHGVGGHIEAYAKNVVELGKTYHIVAFDFVGHGYSEKKTDIEYAIDDYVEQLRELLDSLGVTSAHISGESLGGMVAGTFAVKYPQYTKTLILNTAGGIPIVSEKGHQDVADLASLSKSTMGKAPTFESVRDRMRWLFYKGNWGQISDELVETRLKIYSSEGYQKTAPLIFERVARVAAGKSGFPMLELEKIACPALMLWTLHNPIHDVAAAEAALPRLQNGQLYVMKTPAGHWPQYEDSVEFNAVVSRFIDTGKA